MARLQDTKEDEAIPLTRPWNELLQEMMQNDVQLRRGLLADAVAFMVAGDVQIGKSLLRKYINATVGFIALGEALGKSSKTLMQMLGPNGNPNIRNFFEIVAYLQKAEGIIIKVSHRSARRKIMHQAEKTRAVAKTSAGRAAKIAA